MSLSRDPVLKNSRKFNRPPKSGQISWKSLKLIFIDAKLIFTCTMQLRYMETMYIKRSSAEIGDSLYQLVDFWRHQLVDVQLGPQKPQVKIPSKTALAEHMEGLRDLKVQDLQVTWDETFSLCMWTRFEGWRANQPESIWEWLGNCIILEPCKRAAWDLQVVFFFSLLSYTTNISLQSPKLVWHSWVVDALLAPWWVILVRMECILRS